MRRVLAPLAVALLAVTASAVPVAAADGYLPPQRVQACAAQAVTTSTADGSVWGVSGCAEQLSLLHRTPGGTWSRRPLPFRGHPRAVADDGRTTFFLFASPYAPGGNTLSVAKVPHGGAPSAARVLSSGSDDLAKASLAARDGRWWAVWDRISYGSERATYSLTIHQARSIEPAFAPRAIDLGSSYDGYPRLALRGEGAVLTLHRGLGANGTEGAAPVLATAGADGRFTERPLGIAGAERSAVADLAVAGARTLLVLADGSGLRLALDSGDLVFTTRVVPVRASPRSVSLAASGGRVFVAHSEAFTSAAGHWTVRAYVAEGGVTGPLTTTELSAPFGRVDPAVHADLQDASAARGRATVLATTTSSQVGDALWSQTRR